MSKNTGTSELINYFDLGVNGDVGIAGSLTLDTIANATTDTDTFLVSDTGIIKYRTGAQLLSDIGAQGLLTNPVTGTGTSGQVAYWSSSSEITGTSNFLFNASERNLTIDRSLSTLGNAITISKGSDANQAWLAFRQGGGGNGTWRLGYTGDPYDFTINVGTDSSIGAQTLRIFEDSQNVVIGTSTTDNGAKLQVSGSVNIVGNGSQLLFDSLGSSKSGGIWYVNDFELLINNSRGTGSAIYLGNTNLDFHTNVSGNPRLRIESNGNLGIGTSTPTSSFNARLAVRNEDAANNPTLVLFKNINSSSSEDIFRVQSWNGVFNTVASIRANGGATFLNNVGIGTNSSGNFNALTFTGPFLDVAGVVQIKGTSSNGVAILQFGGDTFRKATIASSIGTEAPYLSFGTASSGSDSSSTERMRITSGGNVLIGTQTDAGSRLQIEGGNFRFNWANSSTAYYLWLNRNSTQDGGILLTKDNTLDWQIANTSTSGNLIFYSYGIASPALTLIRANGNVLIGTSTDNGSKLFVSGSSYLDGYNYASSIQYTRPVSNTVNPAGGNGVLIFSGGQAAIRMDSNYSMNFDMYNGGNQHTTLSIRQGGNSVSINSPDNNLMLELKYQNVASGYLGAISSALYAYSVNGGYVLLNSSSAWVPASDIKRKRNFEPYTKGLSAILGLQPKLYNMDFQKDGDEKQVGLVAQEVRDFIPLAYEENADFIGINYNAVIVTMVKAIQEQQQQIQELKNKLS